MKLIAQGHRVAGPEFEPSRLVLGCVCKFHAVLHLSGRMQGAKTQGLFRVLRTSGGLMSQNMTHLGSSAQPMDLEGHESHVKKSGLASQGSAEGSDTIESVFWKITPPAVCRVGWAGPE